MKAINLAKEADKASGLFEYRRVGSLNGQMLNVLQAENRTLDFHVHEASDELFFMIEGEMELEFDHGRERLSQGELLIVPAGTRHRPVVTGRVKCLLIEREGTLHAGNTGGTYAAGQ